MLNLFDSAVLVSQHVVAVHAAWTLFLVLLHRHLRASRGVSGGAQNIAVRRRRIDSQNISRHFTSLDLHCCIITSINQARGTECPVHA